MYAKKFIREIEKIIISPDYFIRFTLAYSFLFLSLSFKDSIYVALSPYFPLD